MRLVWLATDPLDWINRLSAAFRLRPPKFVRSSPVTASVVRSIAPAPRSLAIVRLRYAWALGNASPSFRLMPAPSALVAPAVSSVSDVWPGALPKPPSVFCALIRYVTGQARVGAEAALAALDVPTPATTATASTAAVVTPEPGASQVTWMRVRKR